MAKRQSGFAVRIEGFIEIDPTDLDAQQKAIVALTKAQQGQPADAFALMGVDKVDVRPKTRKAPAAPTQAASE